MPVSAGHHTVKMAKSNSDVDNGGAGPNKPNNVGVGKFQPGRCLVLRQLCMYQKFTVQSDAYCSRSRRRAEKVDKRMVLVHTDGLFIT
jgi:hypothetical protein